MAKKASKSNVFVRFGEAVRTHRDRLEMTQEELAEKAKMHRTYLSDIERGRRNVSLLNIERLARALSTSIAELCRQV
ncbi:MAG: helix-turn-helix domain-containing protein [Gemmataceae bacterium]